MTLQIYMEGISRVVTLNTNHYDFKSKVRFLKGVFKMPVIVLDPGHGGEDPGAIGYGLQEKDLTLDIALKTRSILSSYQCSVHLTRESDTDLPLADRAALANKLAADSFVSIHVNAGGGTGFESYIYTAGATSVALQQIVHASLASYYSLSGFADRGKKRANFAVLRLSKAPAILLENLFIDQKRDAASLADASFRQGIAGAITAGLVRALNLKPVNTWNPVDEINKLKAVGLINSAHEPADKLTWGVFAAVINRYKGLSSTNDPWEPAKEVSKIKSAGLIHSEHDEAAEVPWGEFATVLNRLRGAGSSGPWDPTAEIRKLMTAGLIDSAHAQADRVTWGEFATVFNRFR